MAVEKHIEPLSKIGDGIVQIRLPMAGNPLRYVNGYLLEDEGGYTLIDCGWKTDDVLEALQAALGELGLSLSDVRRLLITHFHFDHYGLAGTLRRAGVAELWMHRLDWQVAQAILGDPRAADAAADAWIEQNGFAVESTLEEELHHRRTELAQPTHEPEDGAAIGRLRAAWTPGHSPGHLCFTDSVSGAMFTGDHVLDPITPHVGIWHEGRGDALGQYVASLHKVAALGASRVLPAHGEPFDDLQRRVDQLLAHEDTRERGVLAALDAGCRDATAVARALPWTRSERAFETLGPAHQQFAVAETLAHLEHLVVRGALRRDDAVRPICFERA
jgi:glyoxylase-like metal-dependent hydrolase (beta-lactamase superfamily II)